jgi:hypothetical protein
MIVYTLMTILIIIVAYMAATISKGCMESMATTSGGLINILAPMIVQLLSPVLYLVYCGLVLDSCYSNVKSMKAAVR